MLEYGPWSQKALDDALHKYRHGDLSILDLQLGGACNFNCVYCDTPDRLTLSSPKLPLVQRIARQANIDWLFFCGLGEPLAPANSAELMRLLGFAEQEGIPCSMFTNASLLTDEVLAHVQNGTLNVLFKLDSMDPNTLRQLYGTENPALQLRKVKELVQFASVSEGCTNLAASIVTTTANYEEIPALLRFCDDHGVFPLIADLEDSGRGRDEFRALKLGADKLRQLREMVEKDYARDFVVPICPSVIAGIHISHDNIVLVDQETGLSCHWFWLTEPKVMRLLDIEEDTRYVDIRETILSYRDTRLPGTRRLLEEDIRLPIGGCGGDIERMLEAFVRVHEETRTSNK